MMTTALPGNSRKRQVPPARNRPWRGLRAGVLRACRFLALFGLCVIIPLSGEMTRARAELSETRAQELALQYCKDELAYTGDSLCLNQYDSNQDGWFFSFLVKEADPTTNGLIIVHMDGKGNLTDITGPQPISLYQQFQNAWRAAMKDYRAVYQFQQEWKPRLANLSPEDKADFNRMPDQFPYLAFMEHDVLLPTDQDISYEEALAKSKEAILASPGWTAEKLELMRVKAAIYHIPTNADRPVYQFVYRPASFVEPSDEYDDWEKRENEVFGEDPYPINVNVRLDAQTGELVGKVCVQTPGNPIGEPMIFFLWEADRNEPVASEGMGGAK